MKDTILHKGHRGDFFKSPYKKGQVTDRGVIKEVHFKYDPVSDESYEILEIDGRDFDTRDHPSIKIIS